MPQSIIAYSLKSNNFKPEDCFGYLNFENIEIYDPKNFDDWYTRAPHEITQHLKNENDIMIIKGYGIYRYSRDLNDLVKKIAILENSEKMLLSSCNIN